MVFDTQIKGTQCKCRVIFCSPYYKNGDFEFNILDKNNKVSRDLESKVDQDVFDRLYEEFQLEMTGERYGYL